jgi:hypothetical protein
VGCSGLAANRREWCVTVCDSLFLPRTQRTTGIWIYVITRLCRTPMT